MSTTVPPPFDFEELFGVNAGFVEQVYTEYMARPDAVTEEWQRFFERHLPPEHLPERKPEPAPQKTVAVETGETPDHLEPMKGVAAKIAQNMSESLTVPTATSTREIPVKVLEENRKIINEYLVGEVRGKASFTHIIAWAMVRAMQKVPGMLVRYVERDGKAFREVTQSINLGMAVDVSAPGKPRQLVVPNIKDCASMNFATFLAAYDAQIRKARKGKLAPDDFKDTTCSLTNPGTIGTISSLPRLMVGQSFILATGAITYPAAYMGAAQETINELGVSKVMGLTSTYDHRVIQGADSGEFLKWIHELLQGQHDFYDQIFRDLTIPYQPMRLERDKRVSMGSPMRENQTLERAARVMQLIRAYRVRGYLLANLDPLVYDPKTFPELEMDEYGLTIWDLDRTFYTGGTHTVERATLREIRDVLRKTYTRRIGVEYMHMVDREQKEWLRVRMEGNLNEEELPKEVMVRALDRLVEAEAFERFLHTRFVGHKRFSLEGGETLIPVLDALLNHAGDHGVEQGVIGMAHRGRLNVLAHTLGKPLTKIFSEFEGQIDPDSTQGSGDVKYHLGAEDTFTSTSGKDIHLTLACNPSHLEAVNPVVEGMARAMQDHDARGDEAHDKILPILVHGDAAFAGQGVVFETLQMSQLRGYGTGGSIHIIVNNQIGYTTNPDDARSTPFCTDVAKSIQAPIFHVNGDDPLAAVRMVRLALEYRQEFNSDVILDIVCYRRHGHNEGDEPSFTQPLLYKKIEAHPSVRAIYQDWLLRAGIIEQEDAERFNEELHTRYRASLDEVRQSEPPQVDRAQQTMKKAPGEWRADVGPAGTEQELHELVENLTELPSTFTPHPKIEKLLARQRNMAEGAHPFDFATAEALAFASLVIEGHPVRLSGQDSGRGTFSQRHSVLVNAENGEKHVPLNFLKDGQARYDVIDSFLSEEAVLGFEYGYSVTAPGTLCMWEAQFGDFCNGAQIQIDQFLAAGEAKWEQKSGLVLLLPHGYDGQGPEHSSARLERFLQLCAESNMRVANASTAAQYHHLLRRQALDPDKRPLVVMTPKSLLRAREAGSQLSDFTDAVWQPVMAETHCPDSEVERIVFCSGKVFYDIESARKERGLDKVVTVRIEQLAPWPKSTIEAILDRFPRTATRVWCQEEPANMGAYSYLRHRLTHDVYAGRPEAASPATGVNSVHKREQREIVDIALG